jgi:hypothetical protein
MSGQAWNSQLTIDGLALPGLRASVPVEHLEHLQKFMEVDALRLERLPCFKLGNFEDFEWDLSSASVRC